MKVVLRTERDQPLYAIYHAELRQYASELYGTPEGPLYLGGFLTEAARDEHIERAGYEVEGRPARKEELSW